jgi:hypothetical protein
MIMAMMMVVVVVVKQPTTQILLASGRVLTGASIGSTVTGFPVIVSVSSSSYSPRIHSVYSTL